MNMFKSNLYNIQADLKEHHRPRNQLLEYFIQQRLAQSLHTYYKEISTSTQYLSSKNPVRVIKEL